MLCPSQFHATETFSTFILTILDIDFYITQLLRDMQYWEEPSVLRRR